MERTLTPGVSGASGSMAGSPSSSPSTASRMDSAAQSAHQAVDDVSERAAGQVNRLSGAAHRAVDSTTSAATSAAEWASNLPDQARQMQQKVTEAACESIRARPLASVAGALVAGYLLGRLARL